MSLIHKRFGITDSDWIRRAVDEARVDPVGLWAIVQAGRDGFGLQGADLEGFVRRFIFAMVSAGALPVVGGSGSGSSQWRRVDEFGSDAHQVAEAIINQWRTSQQEPDVDGVWFGFPSAIE